MSAANVLAMALVTLMTAGVWASADGVLFDFNDQADARKWTTVNDTVMGGVSNSTFSVTEDGKGVFKGTVSLENYGGFASVRSQLGTYNLSSNAGVALKLRGDGKSYKFTIWTDSRYDGASYQAGFRTKAGEWQTVKLPFTAFKATYRGRDLPDHPALDPGKIRRFGFMIADKQAGAFKLEMDWIDGYLPK